MVKTRRSTVIEVEENENVDDSAEASTSSGLSKSAIWRRRLKENNPEKYEAFLLKERIRNKRNRLSRSAEAIQNDCEKGKVRLQKFREKQKKTNQVVKTRAVFGKKLKEMTVEERREYFKVRQAEYRRTITPQKKTQILRKLRMKRQKNKEMQIDSQQRSSAAIRVMSHRLKEKLPRDPTHFAQSISHIVKNSPRKQIAITNFMVPTGNSTDSALKTKIKELKRKRNLTSKIELNVLKSIASTASRKVKKKALKLINLKIKRRLKISRDSLNEFYTRGDISRPIPRVRNISKHKVMYRKEGLL